MARDPVWINNALKLGLNAGSAVFLFYVISGFLITYTLSRNYTPDRDGLLRFYRNRAVRIFALFWPVAAVAIASFPASFPRSPVDIFTSLFLLGVDWRVALATYPQPYFGGLLDGLHPAWTLGAELTFYLVAPLLMRSWRLGAALLVGSLAIRAAFVWWLGPNLQPIWTYTFPPATFCFFMMGHFAARCAGAAPSKSRIGIVFLILAAVIMTSGPYNIGFDTPRFWIAITLFAAALPGVFALTYKSRALNFLGDLSYPIYLVHVLVFIWLGGIVIALTGGATSKPMVYVTAAIAFAFLIPIACLALAVEKAIRRFLARLERRTMLVKAGEA